MKEMSFTQHLDELRKRLIYIVISLIIGMVFFGIFFDEFIEIILAPKSSNFITYVKFNEFANFLNVESFFAGSFDLELQNRTVSGQMSNFMIVLFVGGFIVSIPLIIYQFWAFLMPALSDIERKFALIGLFVTTLLFLIGVLFSYFVIFPLSIHFFAFFSPFKVTNLWDLNSYISIFTKTLLGFGVLFLLPIIAFVLAKIGILKASMMISFRKSAFVIVLIVSAIITPSDPWTMIVAAIPLWLLYELSILIVKLTYKEDKSLMV